MVKSHEELLERPTSQGRPGRNVERPRRPDGRRPVAEGGSPQTGAPTSAAARRADKPRDSVKILFFSANAVPERQLAVDKELREIRRSLEASRHGELFRLIVHPAAQEGDLQQALMRHEPDIVHFACHGTAEAELLLLSEDGGVAPVPAAALASVFQVLQKNLMLVVFNACWSREQAEAIRRSAGLCIGMRAPIGDAEAIKFAAGFYGALGYGRSVREAFELGAAAIKAATPEPDVPQLFEATTGSAGAVVFSPAAKPAGARWALAAVAVGVGPLLAVLLWASRSAEPASTPPGPPWAPGPPSDMVRYRAASIRPGAFLSQVPAACASEQLAQRCGEAPSESVGEVRVDAFDLDRDEVTHHAFAAWLSARGDTWRISKYGMIETRDKPAIPLVRIVPECGGGLIVTASGQVRAGSDKGRWPVTCVTWYGANEYCRALGKRLPLELEWELAAKGVEGRPFPWGAGLPRQDLVAFDLGDGATRHPREVGTSSQDVTAQGARDLGGNVAEWVEDGRGRREEKTMRGGTWASIGPCHLLGSRCKRLPTESNEADLGFRCARSVMSPSTDSEASP